MIKSGIGCFWLIETSGNPTDKVTLKAVWVLIRCDIQQEKHTRFTQLHSKMGPGHMVESPHCNWPGCWSWLISWILRMGTLAGDPQLQPINPLRVVVLLHIRATRITQAEWQNQPRSSWWVDEETEQMLMAGDTLNAARLFHISIVKRNEMDRHMSEWKFFLSPHLNWNQIETLSEGNEAGQVQIRALRKFLRRGQAALYERK